MEYQKVTNLLDSTSDTVPRFVTKNWIEVQDQSGGAYNTKKRFKTSMLRSDLCDYSDAYIDGKRDNTVEGANNRDKKKTGLYHLKIMHIYFLHFKNKWCINRKCTRFRHCNANVQFA